MRPDMSVTQSYLNHDVNGILQAITDTNGQLNAVDHELEELLSEREELETRVLGLRKLK